MLFSFERYCSNFSLYYFFLSHDPSLITDTWSTVAVKQVLCVPMLIQNRSPWPVTSATSILAYLYIFRSGATIFLQYNTMVRQLALLCVVLCLLEIYGAAYIFFLRLFSSLDVRLSIRISSIMFSSFQNVVCFSKSLSSTIFLSLLWNTIASTFFVLFMRKII